MTYFTTMTSKGQVTLPAPIRKKLNLKPGQRIAVNLNSKNQATIDSGVDFDDLRRRTREHLKKNNIKPLNDDQLKEVIEKSMTDAAIDRYKRSLRR